LLILLVIIYILLIMKKVIAQFNFPGMTAKQYDQAWVELRAVGQSNPKGLLHHFGGQQGNNWVVVDIWESVEAFNKYGETLLPILAKLGVAKIPPVLTPLHYEYEGV
jgi:hypothetical protein